jgi:hypothetical protein
MDAFVLHCYFSLNSVIDCPKTLLVDDRLLTRLFEQLSKARHAAPTEASASPHEEPPPTKKQAITSTVASMQERLCCEICAEEPRRKKEVAIRWCGHSMCKACVKELKRVRSLRCPVCRISFDLQLLVQCRMSDLA